MKVLRSHSQGESLAGWLAFVTLAVVATGMAYTLWWPTVVRHHSWYWVEPGDIWGTVRASHWILWGGFSFVYSSQTGLVTLPGFHLLLTPFVALSSALGLTETAPGYLPVPKPHTWLIVGPATLACSGVALFALDSLARHLGVTRRWRKVLAVAEGAVLWETMAIWGHAEDVLALGFVVFALVRLLKGHERSAGWLLGAAIGAQLYVIALVPLFIGFIGLRKSVALLARAAVIPGFLFVAMAIPNPHDTFHALFDQPNYPTVDYPTPWMLISPKLGRHAVAAGPARLIGLAVAVTLGVVASKRRHHPLLLVWLAAVILTARSVFESVMDPYYIVPALAVALVLAARQGPVRFVLAGMASAGLVVLTYHRLGMWNYWLAMTGIFLALLVVTFPGRRLSTFEPPGMGEDGFERARPPEDIDERVALSNA